MPRVLAFIAALFVLSVPVGAQAAPDCGKWLTPEFWKEAVAADVDRCLSAGADITARGNFGETPLHQAAEHGTAETVNALLDLGADIAARDAIDRIPFDFIEDDSALKGTDAYWRLHEGRFK